MAAVAVACDAAEYSRNFAWYTAADPADGLQQQILGCLTANVQSIATCGDVPA